MPAAIPNAKRKVKYCSAMFKGRRVYASALLLFPSDFLCCDGQNHRDGCHIKSVSELAGICVFARKTEETLALLFQVAIAQIEIFLQQND
jgi:hypothetical protein